MLSGPFLNTNFLPDMKIVFLSRYQMRLQRGAEIFVSELSKQLSKKHYVDVLTGEAADSIGRVMKGEYDIVIPINGRLQSLKVSLSRVIGKYKLLITGHSGIGRDDIWNIAIARPDIFVALTDQMQNWAKKFSWGTKIIKIPNGIDLNKFSPYGDKLDLGLNKPVILSVGALVWYKHHDRLVKAVAETGKGSVLIAGEGPDKKKLEKSGRDLLGNRFKIVNFKYGDMPKVYRSCDLFSLPSWDREAFGLVYLEALSCGLGVVAPDDSSRREIIGDAGVFTDVSDPKKYADAITEALNTRWKEKALNQAEKFSWDKIAKKYEEALIEIL